MNFKRRTPEEPEINLIPFIDVLLVVIIFLMLSTTYAKYSELEITLPVADAERKLEPARQIVVAVAGDGRMSVDRHPVDGRSVTTLASALTAAANGSREAVVVVSADANAAHQSVIHVLEAARRAGLPRLTFATQKSADGL